jgi:hypothetical protein
MSFFHKFICLFEAKLYQDNQNPQFHRRFVQINQNQKFIDSFIQEEKFNPKHYDPRLQFSFICRDI